MEAELASKEFQSKRKAVFGNNGTRFNGVELKRDNLAGVIVLKQSQCIKKIGKFIF